MSHHTIDIVASAQCHAWLHALVQAAIKLEPGNYILPYDSIPPGPVDYRLQGPPTTHTYDILHIAKIAIAVTAYNKCERSTPITHSLHLPFIDAVLWAVSMDTPNFACAFLGYISHIIIQAIHADNNEYMSTVFNYTINTYTQILTAKLGQYGFFTHSSTLASLGLQNAPATLQLILIHARSIDPTRVVRGSFDDIFTRAYRDQIDLLYT